MMSVADLVAIGVETLRIDCEYSMEKEFTELIRMNSKLSIRLIHCMIMYVVLWLEALKYILWMDDHILIMTYESLAMGYLKNDILDTKMIVWSRWDHQPSVFEEIDS